MNVEEFAGFAHLWSNQDRRQGSVEPDREYAMRLKILDSNAEVARLKDGTAWRTALNESEKRELIALAELDEANAALRSRDAEIAALRKLLNKEPK